MKREQVGFKIKLLPGNSVEEPVVSGGLGFFISFSTSSPSSLYSHILKLHQNVGGNKIL